MSAAQARKALFGSSFGSAKSDSLGGYTACSIALLPLLLARARGSVRLSMPAPGSQKPWGSALALSQDPVASPCACVHPLNAGPETECAC
jgi:hypothetical protein